MAKTKLREKYHRALADYRNLEKRVQKERQIFTQLASASLVDKILSYLDNLDRAIDFHPETWLKSLRQQLLDILGTEGVQEIKALKLQFNPETMDCVEVVPGTQNIVKNVIQKGYLLNGKIIRPARVEVGSGVKKS
jgi:molecular chaperone GrpE